jgi:hypothetical protein
MDKRIVLSNKKPLIIALSDFDTSYDLLRELLLTLKENSPSLEGLNINNLGGFSDLLKQEVGGGFVKLIFDNIVSIISNDKLKEIYFKVAERCTYDGERVSKELFNSEDKELRGLYFEIAFHIIKENIQDFFPKQGMKLQELIQTNKKVKPDTQK